MCRRIGPLAVLVVIASLVAGCKSIDEKLIESSTVRSMKAEIALLGGDKLTGVQEAIKQEAGDLGARIDKVKITAEGNSAGLSESAANARSAKETADQVRGEWSQVRGEVKGEWKAQKADVDQWWKDAKAETEDQMNRWLQSFSEKSKTVESTLTAKSEEVDSKVKDKCQEVDSKLSEKGRMVDGKVEMVDRALESYASKEKALEDELKALKARHKVLWEFVESKFGKIQ